jgi:DNA-binding GntR family transcriptional regulator
VDLFKELLSESLLPARRSLSDDVVDRLRAAIVRGVFVPSQRLSEVALAEALGVSRGPIREAFALLEREGLLKLEPHRRARVTSPSMNDIDEIYQLRVALERLAIDRACTYADDADMSALNEIVERLRDATKRADVVAVVEHDVRFHDLIYVAAKHQRLYQSWSLLRPQIETFLISRSADTGSYLGKAVREHAAILDIIRARERTAAIAMIEDHIHSAYERLTRLSSDTAALQKR